MHATSRTPWRIRSRLLFLLQLGPVQLWIMLTLSMLTAKPTWLHVCSNSRRNGKTYGTNAEEKKKQNPKHFQGSGIYSSEKGKHTPLCPAPYERLENNHFVSLAAASPVLSVSRGEIKKIHTLHLKYWKVFSFWSSSSKWDTRSMKVREVSFVLKCVQNTKHLSRIQQYVQHARRKATAATAKGSFKPPLLSNANRSRWMTEV